MKRECQQASGFGDRPALADRELCSSQLCGNLAINQQGLRKRSQKKRNSEAMNSGRTFSKLLLAAAIVALPATAAGSQAPNNRFAAELLDAHNSERDRFGVQRLAWSKKLAREAREWAHVLAREGRMRHASNGERKGAGENLWMGSAGAYSASFMVGAFAEERRHFKPGKFPHISRTGDWRDVGHYTQLVWQGTREVGCAVARNQRDDFLVCRYWPAGNTYGVEIKRLARR